MCKSVRVNYLMDYSSGLKNIYINLNLKLNLKNVRKMKKL